MTDFYLKSGVVPARANSTAYTIGQKVSPARADAQTNNAVMKRYVYECTVDGTSGATPPVYLTTPGNTFTDGTVTWVCRECDSWANASPHMDFIASRLSTGDRLLISHLHNEAHSAAALNATFAGTISSPNVVLCVDDVTGALATTATISASGVSSFTTNGSVYVYGLNLSIGTGASSVSINFAAATVTCVQEWEKCSFQHGSTATSVQQIAIGISTSGGTYRAVTWTNCDVKFAGTGNVISTGSANLTWNGGKIITGSATPSYVFHTTRSNAYQGDIITTGVDFSALSSSATFFSGAGAGKGSLRDCKLPTNWSGALATSVSQPQGRYEMHNCDYAGVDHFAAEKDFAGESSVRTGIYRTGGATTNGTPFCFYTAGSSNANFHTGRFKLRLPPVWVEANVPVTLTYDIAHNVGATAPIKSWDAWLEVNYPADLDSPLDAVVSTAAGALGPSTNHPTGTASWVGVDPAFYNLTQKMQITFTPVKTGWAHPKLVNAMLNLIVYIDPKVQVS